MMRPTAPRQRTGRISSLSTRCCSGSTTTRSARSAMPSPSNSTTGRQPGSTQTTPPPCPAPPPWAALLPALDPTTMRWQARSFYVDAPTVAMVYDRAGNGKPTAWWNGRIIGTWAQHHTGNIVVQAATPLPPDAIIALQAAAKRLTAWLDGHLLRSCLQQPLATRPCVPKRGGRGGSRTLTPGVRRTRLTGVFPAQELVALTAVDRQTPLWDTFSCPACPTRVPRRRHGPCASGSNRPVTPGRGGHVRTTQRGDCVSGLFPAQISRTVPNAETCEALTAIGSAVVGAEEG